jgi:hypothetical protein
MNTPQVITPKVTKPLYPTEYLCKIREMAWETLKTYLIKNHIPERVINLIDNLVVFFNLIDTDPDTYFLGREIYDDEMKQMVKLINDETLWLSELT